MAARFSVRAEEWLDGLWRPPDGASSDTRRQVRLIGVSVAVGAVVILVSALSSIAMGLDRWLIAFEFAWSAAMFGMLGLLRAGKPLGFVANAVVALVFTSLLLLSALSGGRNIGALFAFSALPIFSMLLAGWRSCLVFTALSVLAIVTSPYVPFDALVPSGLPHGSVPSQLVRDAINITLAVGLFSALYDALRSNSLMDAERARDSARQSETSTREFSQRQSALLALVQRLQDTTEETFEAAIELALEQATRLAGANRTALRLIVNGRLAADYSWGDDGNPPLLSQERIESASQMYSWSTRLIVEGRVAQVAHIDELPKEAAAERALLESRGVTSWLCIPVRAGHQAIAYQNFECTRGRRSWTDDDVELLRLMTEIFASAVIRNRAVARLRESEQQFSIAFRNHPDAMVISDLETDVIIECNDQWVREVEAETRRQVVGRSIWDFPFEFPEDQKDAMRKLLREVGRTPPIETQIIGTNKEVLTYILSATRIELGGRPCAITIAHNLTERRQLEEQLMHSQKMEAVGRLAGGIAHDFNNMLTVIAGYSESLSERLEGEERDDAIEIREAARRSAHLTKQLLAFSRRQVLRSEVFDLKGALQKLKALLRPLIGESIDLRLELAEGPEPVHVDRGQLEQVIVNLVVNARDAMPNGGELVLSSSTVDVAPGHSRAAIPSELEPGTYVRLCVADNGEGMSADVAAHVMEPFFTTKPEGQGTGLGLSIVHGFAKQCGGAVALESEPDRGTRVSLFLPMAEADVERESPSRSHEPVARGASGKLTALLVEDERLLRRLTARTLTRAGFDVVTAEDGPQGLARAQELGERLDLLVSDVVMPKFSGIELCQRIREARPHLPVILMSGYPEPASGERALPDDVVFVQKPFDEQTLCAAAAAALEAGEEDAGS